jgi:hypothetical protein
MVLSRVAPGSESRGAENELSPGAGAEITGAAPAPAPAPALFYLPQT